MTNKKIIMMSMLVIAVSLVFANSNVANAQTSKTLDDSDKRALEAIERKRVEAAAKLVSILQEYEQHLKQHKFTNPNTERRVMEDTKSIQNKIRGVIDLLGNQNTTPVEVMKSPTEPYLKKIAQGKFRSNLDDHYRVTYAVHAGNYRLNDAQVAVSSDLDYKQQLVGSMFPNTSNKATFIIWAKDPSTITAKIVN